MSHRALLLIGIVLLSVPVFAADENSRGVVLTGKVTDSEGNLVADAEVRAYGILYEEPGTGIALALIGSITTEVDGAFAFEHVPGKGTSDVVMIVARKHGLSLGWSNCYGPAQDDLSLDIQLGPPSMLAGVVMDENANPLADAEVRAILNAPSVNARPKVLYSMVPCDWAAVTTDEHGKFSYHNIPEDAAAEFVVHAKGYAQISTYTEGSQVGQFSAGRDDIKIHLPGEAIVQGMVIDEKTSMPVPDLQLLLARGSSVRSVPFIRHTCVSAADGSFRAEGLAPGRYTIRSATTRGEDAGYLGRSVSVDVDRGDRKSNIVLKVSRGLVFKVSVLEEGTKTPIEGAFVNLRNLEKVAYHKTRTGDNGVARFWLAPGPYLVAEVSHPDYASMQAHEPTILQEGMAVSLTVSLKGKAEIHGKVLDVEGNPVEGAVVSLLPMSGIGLETNAAGEFEVFKEIPPWVAEQGIVPVMLIRHMERNLAVTEEINDTSKPMNVTLAPAVSIVGKVIDSEGKPVPWAIVRVVMNVGGIGASIGRDIIASDEHGKYEIRAMPLDRTCSIVVNADGYGTGQCEVDAGSLPDQRIEADTITLALANLTLSGKVVDSEDNPVANVRVQSSGTGQPHRLSTSDTDGKFSLQGLCKGELRIQAQVWRGGKQMYGSTVTEGGAEDVVIVIGERTSSGPGAPPPQKSLMGKALPDVSAFASGVSAEALDGKRVLVCFWNMNQRPSRHCMRVLASKAGLLEQQGVSVLTVHAEPVDVLKLKAWMEEFEVPFHIGMIEKNPEVTKKAWGVQRMPWLILTDDKHMVIKEGFKPAKIEESLGQSEIPAEH